MAWTSEEYVKEIERLVMKAGGWLCVANVTGMHPDALKREWRASNTARQHMLYSNIRAAFRHAAIER